MNYSPDSYKQLESQEKLAKSNEDRLVTKTELYISKEAEIKKETQEGVADFLTEEAQYTEENPAKNETNDDSKLKIVDSRGTTSTEALMADEFWGSQITKIKSLEEAVSNSTTKVEFDKNLANYVAFFDSVQPVVKQYMVILNERKEKYDDSVEELKIKSINKNLTEKDRSIAFQMSQTEQKLSMIMHNQMTTLTDIFGENKSEEFTAEFNEKKEFTAGMTEKCTIENKSPEVLALEKKFQMEIKSEDGKISVYHNDERVSTIMSLSRIKSYNLSTSNEELLLSFTYNDDTIGLVKYYLEDLDLIEESENSSIDKLFSIDPDLSAK